MGCCIRTKADASTECDVTCSWQTVLPVQSIGGLQATVVRGVQVLVQMSSKDLLAVVLCDAAGTVT